MKHSDQNQPRKMNRKEYKTLIQDFFDIPKPQKKQAFIQSLHLPASSRSNGSILLGQIRWIPKWVWMMQTFIFLIMLFWVESGQPKRIWQIAAWVPLLALSLLSECGRSSKYGMSELEMTTRFSLKYVQLARLLILGLLDSLLLFILLLLIQVHSTAGFEMGIYLLTPYLLTTWLGMWVMRRIRGKADWMILMIIAFGVSGACIALGELDPWIYTQGQFGGWCLICLLTFLTTGRQCSFLLKESEELVWS